MHSYQVRAVQHLIDHPQAALWLDMGLGKTVITLTAFQELRDRMLTGPMLVVAPLRVCQTVWRQEARKWEHLNGLRFSLIHGSPAQRHRAYRVPADVYLVNYENLRWLAEQLEAFYLRKGKYLPFSTVVYDEVSRLKHHTTKRHIALQVMLPYLRRRIGLTGTPASNGYDNLFGQFLAIDSGQRLGQSIQAYRDAFMKFEGFGHAGKYTVRQGQEQAIQGLIGDVTLQMSNSDYLELPDVLINDVTIPLDQKLRAKYEVLEDELLLELDNGESIEVFNRGALSMKCRQFCNGAAYLAPGEPQWERVHDLKLDALEEVVEEANGKPVLVAYQFNPADTARILAKFPYAEVLSSKLSTAQVVSLENRWNAGEVPMLIGHPQSMGHGLNLQYGPCRDLVFFGLTWSLEDYLQTIARLVRQGQRNNIRVHRLLIEKSVDIWMSISLAANDETQEGLKAALNEYRRVKSAQETVVHDAA